MPPELQAVGLASNIASPRAGDVTFQGPNGSLSLTPLMGMGMYMSIWNDANKYVPMSDYVLKATGAQIGAFETHKISLRRWHYGSFTVPNGVAPILSAFESGWYADVQFE